MLSFLITPYAQRVYWFEVVEVFRRLMLSGVLILFGSGSVKQVIIACFLCLISLKIFFYYSPFESPEDDVLFEVSTWQLFLILWIGLCLRFNEYIKVRPRNKIASNP